VYDRFGDEGNYFFLGARCFEIEIGLQDLFVLQVLQPDVLIVRQPDSTLRILLVVHSRQNTILNRRFTWRRVSLYTNVRLISNHQLECQFALLASVSLNIFWPLN
jgi:hypothetical protein